MSKIPDIEELAMSFEEKITYVSTVVTIVVAAAYAWIIGGRVAGTPVADIAYRLPMLIAVGAMIVLTIVGAIAISIAAAIGAQVTGQGSIDDIDRKDERDKDIDRRGSVAGFYVLSGCVLGVLALALLGSAHFWIANAAFASLLAAGLTSSVVKLAAYRRGL